MQNSLIKDLLGGMMHIEIAEKTVFSVFDGQNLTNITYLQFAKDILQTAGYFAENQTTGQHIAILAPNSYQWVVTFFAIIATGNIAVPMNENLPVEILEWQCKRADISLICHNDFANAEALSEIPSVSFDMLHGLELSVDALYSHEADETILLLFTSGTTGKSKAVTINLENLFSSSRNMFSVQDELLGKTIPKKELITLPLFHVGSIRTMMNRILNGGTLAMGRGAKYVFMDMPKLNPTHVGMVPSMAESLARIMQRTPSEKIANYIGSQLQGIIAVGASMKHAVAEYLLKQGLEIVVIYGMTESTGNGSWCLLDESHIGTIGKPDINMDFRIQDGEILLRSDGVMKGYYNDSEETARVIVDGWLHTGDMGYCDEDGYYYINGRKKNVIILSNGENVNPEEIEATFDLCEAIEECLVYSDGKGICADIYTSNQDVAAVYIKQYNESMPMYRQVYKVNYTDEPLPKTGSGKIKRKENL